MKFFKKLLMAVSWTMLCLWFVNCGSDDDTPEPTPLSVTSFSPTSGESGTQVVITGAGFSTTASENIVKFNGTTATIISASATQLTTQVPSGATTGKISVTTNGETVQSSQDFQVIPLSISSFSPASGKAGSTVTITGTGFSTTPSENIVKVNSETATVTSATSTQLTVTIPEGASTGKISVDVNGISVLSSADFVILTLGITGFSPASGEAGDALIISGTQFSTTLSENIVKINGVIANVTAATSTQLTVTVPMAVTTGKITVEVNGETVESTNNFIIYWAAKAQWSGSDRYSAAAFSIGNIGYLWGGRTNQNYLYDFWAFDPIENVWTQKAEYSGGPAADGFSINGVGYIRYVNKLYAYYPEVNNWLEMATFPGSAEYESSSFVIGDKGYVVGGYYYNGTFNYSKELWEYDPGNGTYGTWTRLADFQGAGRFAGVAFAIDGTGYFGTGSTATGNVSDFWAYYPTTNNWVQKADYPEGISTESVGFAISGKGYIVAAGVYEAADGVWQYDPSSNTWVEKADHPGADRASAVSFTISNKAFFGSGANGAGLLKDFYEFDPRDQ